MQGFMNLRSVFLSFELVGDDFLMPMMGYGLENPLSMIGCLEGIGGMEGMGNGWMDGNTKVHASTAVKFHVPLFR